jgi:glucose-1-phosphate cytidylyltransferase
MKFAILSGGAGTRLSELTGVVNKPLIKLGESPILFHVAYRFIKIPECSHISVLYGFNAERFVHDFNSFFDSEGGTHFLGHVPVRKSMFELFRTDADSDTLERMFPLGSDDDVLVTYGDTLTDVDVGAVLNKWESVRGFVDALTCVVRPKQRFSVLDIDDSTGMVKSFGEKMGYESYYKGCGFIVLKRGILENHSRFKSLERELLPKLANEGRLISLEHKGFWHPIDYLKDVSDADEMLRQSNVPVWLI